MKFKPFSFFCFFGGKNIDSDRTLIIKIVLITMLKVSHIYIHPEQLHGLCF